MDRIRMTGPESPYYRQAMELYAAGFSLHEQRRTEEQIQAMRDPAFHCDALVESGTFIGLLFYWEAVGVTYVEHFAVVEALRSSGAGSRALAAFCPAHAPVVLEIDPPVDAVSTRRKGFYQRLGFAENSYAHRHPPWSSCPGPRPFRQRLTAPFPVCSLTASCGMPRWESASLQQPNPGPHPAPS